MTPSVYHNFFYPATLVNKSNRGRATHMGRLKRRWKKWKKKRQDKQYNTNLGRLVAWAEWEGE